MQRSLPQIFKFGLGGWLDRMVLPKKLAEYFLLTNQRGLHMLSHKKFINRADLRKQQAKMPRHSTHLRDNFIHVITNVSTMSNCPPSPMICLFSGTRRSSQH